MQSTISVLYLARGKLQMSLSFFFVYPKINRRDFEPFNNFDEKSNSGQLGCSNAALCSYLPRVSVPPGLCTTVNKIFRLNCVDLNKSF